MHVNGTSFGKSWKSWDLESNTQNITWKSCTELSQNFFIQNFLTTILWYLEIQGSKNGQSFLRSSYQIVRRSGCGFWSFKTSSLIFLPYGKYSSREDVLLLYRLSRLLKLNKLTFMTFYETIRNRTCSITRSYRLSCR